MESNNHFSQVLLTFLILVFPSASSFLSSMSFQTIEDPTPPPSLPFDLRDYRVISSCVNPVDFHKDVKFVSANLGLFKNSPFCMSIYDSLDCFGVPSAVFTSHYSYGFAIDEVALNRSFGPCQVRNDSNCPLKSTKPSSKHLQIEGSFRDTVPFNKTVILQSGDCSHVPIFQTFNLLSYKPSLFEDGSFCVKAFFSDNCEGLHIQLNEKDLLMDGYPSSINSFSTCDLNCPRADSEPIEDLKPEKETPATFAFGNDDNEDVDSSEKDETGVKTRTNSEGDAYDHESSLEHLQENYDDDSAENDVVEPANANGFHIDVDNKKDESVEHSEEYDNEITNGDDVDESEEEGEISDEDYEPNASKDKDNISEENLETDRNSDEVEIEVPGDIEIFFMLLGWVVAGGILVCLISGCCEFLKGNKRNGREVKFEIRYRREEGLLVPVLYYKYESTERVV